MNAATLFSGIGAPETAMPHWQWAWHAEIEKFPAAVLATRHPESTNLGDVSADDFADRAGAIARPDVLVFGSPCQSFSVAGKRLGLDDPRGNLALVRIRPGSTIVSGMSVREHGRCQWRRLWWGDAARASDPGEEHAKVRVYSYLCTRKSGKLRKGLAAV